MSTGSIRPAAVAGIFYPSDAAELKGMLSEYLERGRLALAGRPTLRSLALVAPHAGYRYSGAVAGIAYAAVKAQAAAIDRVILLSPSHRIAFTGIALPSVDQFETPLGCVSIDQQSAALLSPLSFVQTLDAAHAEEHGIEVHLPFLQLLIPQFQLLPLVVGDADPEQIVHILRLLEPMDNSLILVSSDLSHYLDNDTANEIDRSTAAAIEALTPDRIPDGGACGMVPLKGLMLYAGEKNLSAETLELRNSSTSGGTTERVVGYGAFRFYSADQSLEEKLSELGDHEQELLMEAVKHALVYAAQTEQELPVQMMSYPDSLLEFRSSFVTVRKNAALRGCIGSLYASRPLIEDVVHNAFGAAVLDKRFTPLRESELQGLEIHITLLSALERIEARTEEDVIALLRPGTDGVVLQYQAFRGSFLPVMWERLPDPREMLMRLKEKAGLAADFWAPQVEVFRFTAQMEIHGTL